MKNNPYRELASRNPNATALPCSGFALRTGDMPRCRPGFTLVEMLVGLLLLSAMAGLAFYILASNNQVARVGIARSQVYANGAQAQVNLGIDIKSLMGARPNPITTCYPDRDPLTLAPALDAGLSRGCLIIVPGIRQGTLPRGSGTVNLRCDQLFFLEDTVYGGPTPSAATPPLRSLLQTADTTGSDDASGSATATAAALWLGPIRDADEDPAQAQTWSLGRQRTLLTGNAAFPALSASASPLSPLYGARSTRDVTQYSLANVAAQILALNNTAGFTGDATNNDILVRSFAVPVPTNAAVPASAWPTAVSDPMGDNKTLTIAAATGGYRVFLKNCSECIIQVAMDGNFNGLADTDQRRIDKLGNSYVDDGSHLPDGDHGDLNRTPWDGTTLPKRDLSGDIVWIPQDAVVNAASPTAATVAVPAPLVFWPQDAQPRIVHYGYYQGPDATKYFTNGRGDITPYPPMVNPSGPWPASGGGAQFGDYYLPGGAFATSVGTAAFNAYGPAYNASLAVPHTVAQATVDGMAAASAAGFSSANGQDAATATAVKNALGQVPGGSPASTYATAAADAAYAQRMANYAAIHGWNPAAQTSAGAGSPLYHQPPPAQSRWPTLLRIRVRLHDRRGALTTYNDDFLANGRDNDGDGMVNNPEEARAPGVWFEYVFALPYPRMQLSGMAAPVGNRP